MSDMLVCTECQRRSSMDLPQQLQTKGMHAVNYGCRVVTMAVLLLTGLLMYVATVSGWVQGFTPTPGPGSLDINSAIRVGNQSKLSFQAASPLLPPAPAFGQPNILCKVAVVLHGVGYLELQAQNQYQKNLERAVEVVRQSNCTISTIYVGFLDYEAPKASTEFQPSRHDMPLDHVVFFKGPSPHNHLDCKEFGLCRIKNFFAAVHEGLQLAKSIGATHVLQLRIDLCIEYLDVPFATLDDQCCYSLPNFGTMISDNFAFATTDLLLKLFDPDGVSGTIPESIITNRCPKACDPAGSVFLIKPVTRQPGQRSLGVRHWYTETRLDGYVNFKQERGMGVRIPDVCKPS